LAIAQLILGEKNRSIHDISLRDSVLCAASENSIELWNLRSKKLIKAIEYSNNDILSSISFGHKQTDVVTGSRSGELAIWNMDTGEKNILLASGNQGAITSLNNRNELIAVGFSNKISIVYNLTTGREISRVDKYSKDVTVVKFMNDANLLLLGSGDGEVSCHNLETGENSTLLNYSKWIRDIAISSDSSKFAIGYDDGIISILKVAGKFQNALKTDRIKVSDWISSLDYHPTEDCMAYSTLSGKVYIKTRNGNYTKKLNKNVIRVKFIPRSDNFLSLVVATRGEGLIILDAVNMKLKN
jgi:WD40 repeat protein